MLVLPQLVTHVEAASCLKIFLQSIDKLDGPVEADASQLQTFDSSVLALLLECKRHASAQGKYFLVHHMPERLHALAQVYGVGGLIESNNDPNT